MELENCDIVSNLCSTEFSKIVDIVTDSGACISQSDVENLKQASSLYKCHKSVREVYKNKNGEYDYKKRTRIVATTAMLSNSAYQCDTGITYTKNKGQTINDAHLAKVEAENQKVYDKRTGLDIVEKVKMLKCSIPGQNDKRHDSINAIFGIGEETNVLYVIFRGSSLSNKNDFIVDALTTLTPFKDEKNIVIQDVQRNMVLVNSSVQDLLEKNTQKGTGLYIKDAVGDAVLKRVSHIVVSGHSLGGALSEMFTCKLYKEKYKQRGRKRNMSFSDRFTTECITFGAISVGNKAYYNYSKNIPITRLQNSNDGLSRIVGNTDTFYQSHDKKTFEGHIVPITWDSMPIPSKRNSERSELVELSKKQRTTANPMDTFEKCLEPDNRLSIGERVRKRNSAEMLPEKLLNTIDKETMKVGDRNIYTLDLFNDNGYARIGLVYAVSNVGILNHVGCSKVQKNMAMTESIQWMHYVEMGVQYYMSSFYSPPFDDIVDLYSETPKIQAFEETTQNWGISGMYTYYNAHNMENIYMTKTIEVLNFVVSHIYNTILDSPYDYRMSYPVANFRLGGFYNTKDNITLEDKACVQFSKDKKYLRFYIDTDEEKIYKMRVLRLEDNTWKTVPHNVELINTKQDESSKKAFFIKNDDIFFSQQGMYALYLYNTGNMFNLYNITKSTFIGKPVYFNIV